MKNRFEIRGVVTAIFVNSAKGEQECLIDTADLEKVSSVPGAWRAEWSKKSRTFYVRTASMESRKSVRIFIHRRITDAPDGMDVDHLHHNGLDNRRSELLVSTRSENLLNRRGPNQNNQAGIKGIYRYSKTGKWYFVIRTKSGKRIQRGAYTTPGWAYRAQQKFITLNEEVFGGFVPGTLSESDEYAVKSGTSPLLLKHTSY